MTIFKVVSNDETKESRELPSSQLKHNSLVAIHLDERVIAPARIAIGKRECTNRECQSKITTIYLFESDKAKVEIEACCNEYKETLLILLCDR